MRQALSVIGAVIGDTIGSIYEFNPTKDYNFEMFDDRMEYTDDSIMTIAVADWILQGNRPLNSSDLIDSMQWWGHLFDKPMGDYGHMFRKWINSSSPKPYKSWGNGSAMRVSPVGMAFNSLEETLEAAQMSASVTHNHPEGIKGAQATAAAIYLARTGKSKDEIREYISKTFDYNLNMTCDEIRPDYEFDGSCQGTVPQSIVAFLDSKDFEDAIRLTVSLGGDADTMGSITGGIAAAFYKEIPDKILDFVVPKLPENFKHVIDDFALFVRRNKQ